MLWRIPKPDEGLRLRFFGVRGSVPVSGPDFVEFGGNTPCVEVRCGERLFIVDAGTGLPHLGHALAGELPDEVDILLSHLHLDHVGGLPFFKPAVLSKDRTLRIHCGSLNGDTAQAALDRLYAPPLFPITLSYLPVQIEHHGFKAGETLRMPDGHSVDTHPLNHPDGCAGYRFRHAGRTACYISDIEHSDPWPDPALCDFIRDADLVIYDGMFSEAEYSRCVGWGHSTWQKGVELAQAANVERLAIYHLYPGHTDSYLRGIEAEMQTVMPGAFIARERQQIVLAPLGEPMPA